MPDFFEPDSAFDISRFPPKTDEDKAAIQAFFGSTASPSAAIIKLKAFGEALKSNGVKRVGVYGMCWGVYHAVGLFSSVHIRDRW